MRIDGKTGGRGKGGEEASTTTSGSKKCFKNVFMLRPHNGPEL